MSEDTEPKYLSIEQLGKLKLTEDHAQMLKAIVNAFPKPKAKAKGKSSGSGGGKKTEEQIVLSRLSAGAVNSKNKLNAETDQAKKTESLKNRRESFRKSMSDFLAQTGCEEADVTKVVKNGLAVLLDVHKPAPPKAKPEPKGEKAEAPTQSA